MRDFFDFKWGKEGLDKAHRAKDVFGSVDTDAKIVIESLLIACVVTARGKRRSPSSVLELLINAKRRTNPSIIEHINDAWNVLMDQMGDVSDRIDVLTSLVSPKHRNTRTGISETLGYQLGMTYESLVDSWATVADFMAGFRSMMNSVFGVGGSVSVSDYLHRGMTRGQLLQAFGHELKDTNDDDLNDDDED